jgi:hypothetical protein
MAPRLDVRDRKIGVVFGAYARDRASREISFSIRADSEEFFGALVIIAE